MLNDNLENQGKIMSVTSVETETITGSSGKRVNYNKIKNLEIHEYERLCSYTSYQNDQHDIPNDNRYGGCDSKTQLPLGDVLQRWFRVTNSNSYWCGLDLAIKRRFQSPQISQYKDICTALF